MSTYADLSSKLLIDAAAFFRTLAEQNEPIKEQMEENANVFEQMASLVAQNPTGELDGTSHASLTGKLLIDVAVFFRTLASQNEDIKAQMEENANVYEQIGNLVAQNPMGELPKTPPQE